MAQQMFFQQSKSICFFLDINPEIRMRKKLQFGFNL